MSETQQTIRLFGASGHAKVVISVIRNIGLDISGVYDDNNSLEGQLISGCKVIGPLSLSLNTKSMNNFFISIGQNSIRKQIDSKFGNLDWTLLRSPVAYIDSTVTIGVGTIIMAGSIIQPETKIGRHCIVNTGASIDHECMLGEFSQVSPGAILCGNVIVGECSYIGAGAVVKQGIKIGSNVMIGAGSVVVNDIPENCMVFGNPAVVIKKGMFV